MQQSDITSRSSEREYKECEDGRSIVLQSSLEWASGHSRPIVYSLSYLIYGLTANFTSKASRHCSLSFMTSLLSGTILYGN